MRGDAADRWPHHKANITEARISKVPYASAAVTAGVSAKLPVAITSPTPTFRSEVVSVWAAAVRSEVRKRPA